MSVEGRGCTVGLFQPFINVIDNRIMAVLIRTRTDTNYFGERKVAFNLIWEEKTLKGQI